MLHDFKVVNLETIVMGETINLPIYDLTSGTPLRLELSA